jgi:hypothetical protein
MRSHVGLKRMIKNSFGVFGKIKGLNVFGLTSWKNSMRFRFAIEAILTLGLTIYFQMYMSQFNLFLHEANHEVHEITEFIENGFPPEEIAVHQGHLLEDLENAHSDFWSAFTPVLLYLLVPIDYIIRKSIMFKTKKVVQAITTT